MFMVNNSKFAPYKYSISGSDVPNELPYTNGRDVSVYNEDSGNEEYEEFEESEEIVLPEDEGEEEDVHQTNEDLPMEEAENEILYRQMSYPPLPEYQPPDPNTTTQGSPKRKDPRERVGVLTPMEEVTEPPSSAGTEASGPRTRRSSHRRQAQSTKGQQEAQAMERISENNNSDQVKHSVPEFISNSSSLESPERKVHFESSKSDGSSQTLNSLNGQNEKEGSGEMSQSNESKSKSESSSDPIKEQLEKVMGHQFPNNRIDYANTKESNIDAEFASILDHIIAELHTWDRLNEADVNVNEVVASRQEHLANVSSQLTTQLNQISPQTVISNLPQIIPLLTTLLSLTEANFRGQLSSLNAVTVFAEKVKECKNKTGLKALPNADLTWLVRTLCDISSESSSKSVLKNVATSALATLVKCAGPQMIMDPILLILTGTDQRLPQRPEGSGKIVATGVPGGAPKVKAIALDTLTFALLTFPRDSFDMDSVAKLACHCLLHSKRRLRQAALECLAVIAHAMGTSNALPKFRKFIEDEQAKEEEAIPKHVSAPPPPPSPKKVVGLQPHYDPELEIDPAVLGPPSRIPVPVNSPKKTRNGNGNGIQQQEVPSSSSPVKTNKGRLNAGSAISARISRHVLPTPNLDEMVEYGVKIPSKLFGSSGKLASTSEGTNDGRITSSSESVRSGNNSIDNSSTLELEPVLNSRGSGGKRQDSSEQAMMAADIQWILQGKGPVKRYDPPAGLLPGDMNTGLLTVNPSIKYRQGSSSNLNHTNSSEPESDITNNTQGSSTTANNARSSSMRRGKPTKGKGEMSQDSSFEQQNQMLERYYYPSSNTQMILPRSGITNSPHTLHRGYSSSNNKQNSYTLLPSKYSVLKNNGQQYRPDANHELVTTHALLPGAYDYASSNGFVEGEGGSWHSDLGRIPANANNLKPMMHPNSKRPPVVHNHNNWESANNNSKESPRSISQQSLSPEEDYEYEMVEEVPPKNKVNPTPVNSHRPPAAPTGSRRQSQQNGDSGRKEDMMQQQVKEYHVYQSTVQMDQQPPIPITYSTPPPQTTTTTGKRGEADSAGSTQTRDSGISFGSSKTPPSAQNTPPSQHRTPINTRKGPTIGNNDSPPQIGRNWRSIPELSDESDETRHSGRNPKSSRDNNNSGKSNGNKEDWNRRASLAEKGVMTVSTSHENIPVHTKPVLARRGNSLTRTPGSSSRGDSEMSQANAKPPSGSSRKSRNSGQTRGEENINHSWVNWDDEHEVRNNQRRTSSLSQLPPSAELRNSVSTGSIVDDASIPKTRIPVSRSSYFDENGSSISARSYKGGPFGDTKPKLSEMPSSSRKNLKNSPTKVYKGSYREINSRKPNGTSRNEMFPADLKPVTSPRHCLPIALGQLDVTDWETNVDGFRQLVRMIRFDPDFVREELHTINMAALKHLTNLRSQVGRAAILCYKELFVQMGRSMESDCEKICEKLLDKGADTNKFIREDGKQAMEAMIMNIAPSKSLACLDMFGTGHRNPTVRCTTANLTAKLVEMMGPDRCLAEFPDRLLPMLCRLLQEGSLETRTSAKTAMSILMTHPSFFAQLRRFVPDNILRHSQKSIEALQK